MKTGEEISSPTLSVSSQSTLEPQSPCGLIQPAAVKVNSISQRQIILSRTPSLKHVPTKKEAYASATVPVSNRETQSHSDSLRFALKSKTPIVMHSVVCERDTRSVSPASSITSGGTSELMQFSPFAFSPPPCGSNSSWSSLPCPSLASVTSQCDTDCLIVADASTGIIPDAMSDAATDELVGADPYARNIRRGNTNASDSTDADYVVSVPTVTVSFFHRRGLQINGPLLDE